MIRTVPRASRPHAGASSRRRIGNVSAPILALVLALTACHDDAPSLAPCDLQRARSATLTVDSGATPVLRWSPACLTTRVTVDDLDDTTRAGDMAWHLRTSRADSAIVRPPLRYGDAPAGTITETGPLPLVVGHRYFVVVWAPVTTYHDDSPYVYTHFTR